MRNLLFLLLILNFACEKGNDGNLTVAPITERQIGGRWRCEPSSELLVPKTAMKSWGHTQGIAVTDEFVFISSQVKKVGAILLKFNRKSGEFLAHKWLSNSEMDHPSDIQICENTIAVAVAVPKRNSLSKILFCDVNTLECVGDSILIEDHIGALAFGRFKGRYYFFGGTWDSNRLVVYSSGKRNRAYRLQAYENWLDLITPDSIDSLKSKYNALHFYPQKTGAPLLYASSGNVLDLWEFVDLDTGKPGLKKIYSKKTDGYIAEGNGRLFHEGMDVHQIGEQIFYFAAPLDFNADSTRTEFFQTPHYYICKSLLD